MSVIGERGDPRDRIANQQPLAPRPAVGDHLDPHCPAQRYRLYRRRGTELVCVAATPNEADVVALIRDQRDPDAGATLLDDDAVGILDSHGFRDHNPLDEHGNYTLPGSWLIRPWTRQ